VRELRHDHDRLRDLVAGQPAVEVGEQVDLGDAGALLERHDGPADLAPLLVYAERSALRDRRMCVQGLPDLGRVDVLPTGDVHVLEPVDDAQVPSSSTTAMSPVRSQPSTNASSVAASFRQ
jgi:hypothetical protein